MNDPAKVTLISGKAIASTLKTVSTLGEIGKKILDSAGIQEIDLEGWYPSYLRNQIFDETVDRFGSEALFVFGINAIFAYRDAMAYGQQLRDNFLNSLALNSSDENMYVALYDVMKKNNVASNTLIKYATRGQHDLYGAELLQKSKTNFQIFITAALNQKHEAFFQGSIQATLGMVLMEKWEIDVATYSIIFNPELDMTTFGYEVNLKKYEGDKSLDELLIDLQIAARDALMQKVVLDSDNSLRKLDASHKVVIESVNYASRLQRGQLPRQDRIERRFSSFASIWEPRDTIGGDLYWLSSSQQSGPFVLAVADCTGHGVPGAMLSLLVSNSLERIYANDTAEDPAAALMSLDHYVRTGLNQDRAGSESDDGCDAAVLRIDRDKNTIEFAGAKLGLFQVNAQGVLTRHQSARCSLGYQDVVVEADKPVVKKISYQSGDVFAVVTDGFTDQIGGSTGKTSFGYRRLEDILKANYKASAEEITVAMRNEFAAWQGTNARRDDVTAVVFRL
ncbi:MAG: serine/threonine-protein phosphatase [Burkholderiales bacterium]|nr:serine/threonine-protein phosphatase [Burkholderiales bacterium]